MSKRFQTEHSDFSKQISETLGAAVTISPHQDTHQSRSRSPTPNPAFVLDKSRHQWTNMPLWIQRYSKCFSCECSVLYANQELMEAFVSDASTGPLRRQVHELLQTHVLSVAPYAHAHASAALRLQLRALLVQGMLFLDRMGVAPGLLLYEGRWALLDELLDNAFNAAAAATQAAEHVRRGQSVKLASRNPLWYGAPGVGKSFLLKKLALALPLLFPQLVVAYCNYGAPPQCWCPEAFAPAADPAGAAAPPADPQAPRWPAPCRHCARASCGEDAGPSLLDPKGVCRPWHVLLHAMRARGFEAHGHTIQQVMGAAAQAGLVPLFLGDGVEATALKEPLPEPGLSSPGGTPQIRPGRPCEEGAGTPSCSPARLRSPSPLRQCYPPSPPRQCYPPSPASRAGGSEAASSTGAPAPPGLWPAARTGLDPHRWALRDVRPLGRLDEVRRFFQAGRPHTRAAPARDGWQILRLSAPAEVPLRCLHRSGGRLAALLQQVQLALGYARSPRRTRRSDSPAPTGPPAAAGPGAAPPPGPSPSPSSARRATFPAPLAMAIPRAARSASPGPAPSPPRGGSQLTGSTADSWASSPGRLGSPLRRGPPPSSLAEASVAPSAAWAATLRSPRIPAGPADGPQAPAPDPLQPSDETCEAALGLLVAGLRAALLVGPEGDGGAGAEWDGGRLPWMAFAEAEHILGQQPPAGPLPAQALQQQQQQPRPGPLSHAQRRRVLLRLVDQCRLQCRIANPDDQGLPLPVEEWMRAADATRTPAPPPEGLPQDVERSSPPGPDGELSIALLMGDDPQSPAPWRPPAAPFEDPLAAPHPGPADVWAPRSLPQAEQAQAQAQEPPAMGAPADGGPESGDPWTPAPDPAGMGAGQAMGGDGGGGGVRLLVNGVAISTAPSFALLCRTVASLLPLEAPALGSLPAALQGSPPHMRMGFVDAHGAFIEDDADLALLCEYQAHCGPDGSSPFCPPGCPCRAGGREGDGASGCCEEADDGASATPSGSSAGPPRPRLTVKSRPGPPRHAATPRTAPHRTAPPQATRLSWVPLPATIPAPPSRPSLSPLPLAPPTHPPPLMGAAGARPWPGAKLHAVAFHNRARAPWYYLVDHKRVRSPADLATLLRRTIGRLQLERSPEAAATLARLRPPPLAPAQGGSPIKSQRAPAEDPPQPQHGPQAPRSPNVGGVALVLVDASGQPVTCSRHTAALTTPALPSSNLGWPGGAATSPSGGRASRFTWCTLRGTPPHRLALGGPPAAPEVTRASHPLYFSHVPAR
ncbi:hypothetical protein PAPYR_3691 [Paratrimastix pyriformis]|uniref:Uncharacterized protein n=1 Tax=Paratrimastix pyriformis TaxID=342808 RepID=A0ABQ8UM81_9EUKA|nr:hypothetical protein PAPYR_3691 [Paratrimastix pyriformis]